MCKPVSMTIQRVKIANFRSIDTLGPLDLGPINLLVGRNNSGKSSIIRAMLAGQVGATLDASLDVRIGADTAVVELTFSPPPPAFLTRRGSTGNEVDLITTLSRSNGLQHRATWASGRMATEPGPIPADRAEGIFVPILGGRRVANYATQLSLPLANALIDRDDYVTARISALTTGSHPASVKYRELVRSILGVEISAVLVGDGQQPGLAVNARSTIPVQRMGEGVGGALRLITELPDAEGKVFLVEEPESDLHPAALRALLDAMAESSQSNQFVVSTHSDLVVRRLGAEPGARIYSVTQEDVEGLPTTQVRAIESAYERLDLLSELGYEVDTPPGWLLLEESSAEVLLREFLIPTFAPGLGILRTVAANGSGDVERKFSDLENFVLFAHLGDPAVRRAWVLVDGDSSGRKVVEQLRRRFSSWPAEHFQHLSQNDLESYYPPRFADAVSEIRTSHVKDVKRSLKKRLLVQVRDWCREEPATAAKEFESSAADLIATLNGLESLVPRDL